MKGITHPKLKVNKEMPNLNKKRPKEIQEMSQDNTRIPRK